MPDVEYSCHWCNVYGPNSFSSGNEQKVIEHEEYCESNPKLKNCWTCQKNPMFNVKDVEKCVQKGRKIWHNCPDHLPCSDVEE